MEDFRLKVFCCVARNLSFTKASQQLGISQPAISRHIQELEQVYGTLLFERHTKAVSLTAAGETLLRHSEAILERYRRLDRDMRAHANDMSGRLRIGGCSMMSHYVLPRLSAMFATQYKRVRVELIEGTSESISQAVESGDLDIGIVVGSGRVPGLRYTPFVNGELIFVVDTSRVNEKGRERYEDINNVPVVVSTPDSATYAFIKERLDGCGMSSDRREDVVCVPNDEATKQYVTTADCVALVSRDSVVQELKSGRLTVLNMRPVSSIEYETVMVRKLGESSPAAKEFIRFVQENMSNIGL